MLPLFRHFHALLGFAHAGEILIWALAVRRRHAALQFLRLLRHSPVLFAVIHPDEEKFRPYAAYTNGDITKDRWTDPTDRKLYDDAYTGVWRWRAAMWADLMARMHWCVQP